MVGSYKGLFAQADDGGDTGGGETDGGDEPVTFRSHWGWLATVDDLAKGDRSKWEYYLNMNLIEFFNTLAFQKDKQEDRGEFINKLVKGKTAEEANVILLSYIINQL